MSRREEKLKLTETFPLSNGMTIPKLGFGTWLMQGQVAQDAVRTALDVGYRLIDTAQAYGNETEVGAAIRGSRVDREEIFVVDKVAAELKDYDGVRASIQTSVETMNIGPIDLMLIHSPQPWKEVNQSEDRCLEGNREAWKAMQDAVRDGDVKAIGVSNFEESDLENILGMCEIQPAVNEILCHVGHTPTSLVNWCQDKDIRILSYSPVGHGPLLKDMMIREMAAKYDVSPAQLCIRYDIELGTIPIPKASTRTHMTENAEVDFVIDGEDMKKLKEMVYLDGYGDADKYPVFGGKL